MRNYRIGIALCSTFILAACADARSQDIVFPINEWASATPSDVFLDTQSFADAVSRLDTSRMMIIRNGRALIHGSGANERLQINSIKKALVSTVLGMLVDDGRLDLSDPVAEYWPVLHDQYPTATFEHFVTQTSGFNGFVDLPMAPLFTPPGSQFAYDGRLGANDVLISALDVVAGEPTGDVFDRRVSGPIGMTPSELVTVDPPFLSPNDLARFGLLYLNDGAWAGEQLISSNWVQEATEVQVLNIPNHPRSGANFVNQYGYGWWQLTPGWFEAIGSGNNILAVSPNSGLIVVSLGGNDAALVRSVMQEIQEADMPFRWDGQGDGNWHSSNETGHSRWVVGARPQTHLPQGTAIVQSDMIGLESPTAIYSLRVEENGGVRVNDAVQLDAVNVEVGSTGQLNVMGEIDVHSIAIEGVSAVSSGGSAVASELNVVDGGNFTVGGESQFGSVVLAGGSMVVDAAVTIGHLTMSEGSIVMRDSGSPASASGRVELSAPHFRFVLDSPSWGSPLSFTESRRSPRLSGSLEIELAPEFDPSKLEGRQLSIFRWNEQALPRGEFTEVLVPARLEVDETNLYVTGELLVTSVLTVPVVPGDFNIDGGAGVDDIDELALRITLESEDRYFDVNGDGAVTASDLAYLVENILGTRIGDANLDLNVDFSDFLSLSSDFGEPGGWGQGDFDGDGEVAFDDFLLLSENFGQQSPSVATVPEPNAAIWSLFLFFAASLGLRRLARVVGRR